MRNNVATAAAFVLGALALTAPASAHFLHHGRHMTVREHVAYFGRSVAHDRAQVQRDRRLLVGLSLTTGVESIAPRPLARLIASRVRWHRHAFRWHRAQLHRYTTKLAAQQRAAALPAHLQGWLCIHGREGAWYSNTGNGFYNGLQMTWGWGPLVGDPNNYTPLQVMQAAESEYARQPSTLRDRWMRGQWPNTYPPCASLF